jgi:hypothetical protein
MKTIKLLSMAVIAVGLASCSSSDEFVSSSKKTAESELIPINLSYSFPSQSTTRASSTAGYALGYDFAPTGSPYDVTVGLFSNSSSVTYNAGGYVWTCEAGKMTKKDGTATAYFPTDATFDLWAYAYYPNTLLAGITNPFGTFTESSYKTLVPLITAASDEAAKKAVDFKSYGKNHIVYPTDQSTDQAFKDYDYLLGMCMWEKKSGETFYEDKTIEFDHAGTKITVWLKGGTGDGTATATVTDADIKTAKVELLNFNTHAGVDATGIKGLPEYAWTTGSTATDNAGTVFNYQNPDTLCPTPSGQEKYDSYYAETRTLLGSHSIGSVVLATPAAGIGDFKTVKYNNSDVSCAVCSVILPPQVLLWGVPGIRITIGTKKVVVYIDKTIITTNNTKGYWEMYNNNENVFYLTLTQNTQKELNVSNVSYTVGDYGSSTYTGNATIK